MTEKQYVRIVDHLEKEVQIFDTINEKKIFNIFFNELDSAICLNGALTDVVDLLNELHEENQDLKAFNQDLSENLSVCANKRLAQGKHLTELTNENEQLKSFIDDLTTKGTGRIDLANGYSYSVSAVLTNWKGDVE